MKAKAGFECNGLITPVCVEIVGCIVSYRTVIRYIAKREEPSEHKWRTSRPVPKFSPHVSADQIEGRQPKNRGGSPDLLQLPPQSAPKLERLVVCKTSTSRLLDIGNRSGNHHRRFRSTIPGHLPLLGDARQLTTPVLSFNPELRKKISAAVAVEDELRLG